MDKLNPEIILEIFSHISYQGDVANFRLVQRSFAQLGKAALCRSVDIGPTERSLSRFFEYSCQSDFALHVKEVALVCDDVRSVLWDPFNAGLKLGGISPEDEDETQMAKAKTMFSTVLQESKDFRESLGYRKLIAEALKRLPRLGSVLIESSEEIGKDLKDLGMVKYFRQDFSAEVWGMYQCDSAFVAMINALHAAGTILPSFSILCPLSHYVFGDTKIFRGTAAVFRNCRWLNLWLGLSDGHEDFPCKWSRLPCPPFGLISPALHLEELALRFDVGISRTRLFAEIFGQGHVWPHLRALSLRGVDMHEYEIIRFLRLHKATLKFIQISYCEMYTGCWERVMKFAKEELLLTSIRLYYVWDGVPRKVIIQMTGADVKLEESPNEEELEQVRLCECFLYEAPVVVLEELCMYCGGVLVREGEDLVEIYDWASDLSVGEVEGLHNGHVAWHALV